MDLNCTASLFEKGTTLRICINPAVYWNARAVNIFMGPLSAPWLIHAGHQEIEHIDDFVARRPQTAGPRVSLVDRYVDRSGVSRVKGNGNLKKSQAYPLMPLGVYQWVLFFVLWKKNSSTETFFSVCCLIWNLKQIQKSKSHWSIIVPKKLHKHFLNTQGLGGHWQLWDWSTKGPHEGMPSSWRSGRKKRWRRISNGNGRPKCPLTGPFG